MHQNYQNLLKKVGRILCGLFFMVCAGDDQGKRLNTGLVFSSKAADHFFICNRQGVIFDSAKTLRPYTQQQIEDKIHLEIRRKPDTKELLQSVSNVARYKNLDANHFPFLMSHFFKPAANLNPVFWGIGWPHFRF